MREVILQIISKIALQREEASAFPRFVKLDFMHFYYRHKICTVNLTLEPNSNVCKGFLTAVLENFMMHHPNHLLI